MDPEKRLLAHRVELLIEFLVILVFQLRRLAHPCGRGVVDDVVGIRIYVFAILPLLLFAESDLDRQEAAVLLQ